MYSRGRTKTAYKHLLACWLHKRSVQGLWRFLLRVDVSGRSALAYRAVSLVVLQWSDAFARSQQQPAGLPGQRHADISLANAVVKGWPA